MPDELDRADVEQRWARKLTSQRAGDRVAGLQRAAGAAAQAAGRAEQATGAAMQAAGAATAATGRAAQAGGRAASRAGQGMVRAGVGLSETGVGAIAGVPLAAVGAVVGAGGVAAQAGGRAAEAGGRAAQRAGRQLNAQGKQVANAGRQLGSAAAAKSDDGDGEEGDAKVTGKLAAKVRRGSAWALRMSWFNIIFVVPGVYILLHFWGRYILRSPLFCRFGEEWTSDVKQVARVASGAAGSSLPVGKLLSRGQRGLEVLEFAALPVVLLVVGAITSCILAVGYVADYVAEHPFTTIVCSGGEIIHLIGGAGEYADEVIECVLDRG